MILIAGGYEKGLSLEPFIAEALRAKHIIFSGPTSVRIVEALAGRVPTSVVPDLRAAVNCAAGLVELGIG